MENSKMKETLEVLGLESFESASLDQLFNAITEKLPSDASKLRTLSIYVMWLHPRLMAIDVSTEGSLTKDIATWYQFLKDMATHDHLIFEAFHDWQRNRAIEDPTSSRRLSIAEAALRSLMTAPPTSSKPVLEPATPKPEGLYGQMHPDRVRLSQKTPTVIEIDDDDDDDDAVVVSSRSLWDDRTPPPKNGRARQPDLSFLTGANMLAVKDMSKAQQKKKSPEPSKTKRKLSGKSSELRPAQPRTEEARALKQPPPNYTCDRCGQKGHFLKECPTNLDPAFDRTPPKDYKCHFCKKVGVHYGPMCPRNPQPDSIARQRREHAKTIAASGRADGGRRVEHGDHSRDDRPERLRDGRQSQLDNSAPARDRSASPVRGSRRRRHGDKYRPEDQYRSEDRYRPEDEFSRLSLSAPEHQRKRKASRSPSLHKVEPRKKSQTWADDSAADRPLNRRTFFDDVASRRGNQWEGRLSYDDEDDQDVPQTRSAKRVAFAPAVEVVEEMDEMDVDEPKTPVSDKREESGCASDGWFFELEITEMIQAERAKTDVYLLLDKLFKGPEEIWTNQTFNNIRPRSTDFYEILEDDESVETSDCEMVAEIQAAKDEEEDCVSGRESVDSAEVLETPVLSAIPKQNDAMMVDAESVVSAGPAINTSSTTIVAENPQTREHSNSEAQADTGIGIIATSSNDGSIPNAVMQEAASATVTDKGGPIFDDSIASSSTKSAPCEEVDTETNESSPPLLVEDGAPGTKGSATGKSVADLVAESTVDAAMTDVEGVACS